MARTCTGTASSACVDLPNGGHDGGYELVNARVASHPTWTDENCANACSALPACIAYAFSDYVHGENYDATGCMPDAKGFYPSGCILAGLCWLYGSGLEVGLPRQLDRQYIRTQSGASFIRPDGKSYPQYQAKYEINFSYESDELKYEWGPWDDLHFGDWVGVPAPATGSIDTPGGLIAASDIDGIHGQPKIFGNTHMQCKFKSAHPRSGAV